MGRLPHHTLHWRRRLERFLETAVARYTQAVMDAIGEAISERPEQWLWTHNRWKERPEPRDGSPPTDGGGT